MLPLVGSHQSFALNLLEWCKLDIKCASRPTKWLPSVVRHSIILQFQCMGMWKSSATRKKDLPAGKWVYLLLAKAGSSGLETTLPSTALSWETMGLPLEEKGRWEAKMWKLKCLVWCLPSSLQPSPSALVTTQRLLRRPSTPSEGEGCPTPATTTAPNKREVRPEQRAHLCSHWPLSSLAFRLAFRRLSLFYFSIFSCLLIITILVNWVPIKRLC